MKRVLAIDVGDKRIGLAISDPLGITAQGLETYTRAKDDPAADADYIVEMAKRYKPVRLLFGMPRNMDGSYGFASDKVKVFASLVLERWDGEHAFQDERLTTASARRVLLEADMRRDKRKQVIDKVAAVLILQSYLDAHGNT